MNAERFVELLEERFSDWYDEVCEAPRLIDESLLERSGYAAHFPHLIVREDNARTPASCLHVYGSLAHRRFEEPYGVFISGSCARSESSYDTDRLREFTMAEVVVFAQPSDIERVRRELRDRTQALFEELGIAGSFEPATDAFFLSSSRGAKLIQQARELKLEFRSHGVALCSLNNHEDALTKRFSIDAHSLCLAFGVERVVSR